MIVNPKVFNMGATGIRTTGIKYPKSGFMTKAKTTAMTFGAATTGAPKAATNGDSINTKFDSVT